MLVWLAGTLFGSSLALFSRLASCSWRLTGGDCCGRVGCIVLGSLALLLLLLALALYDEVHVVGTIFNRTVFQGLGRRSDDGTIMKLMHNEEMANIIVVLLDERIIVTSAARNSACIQVAAAGSD